MDLFRSFIYFIFGVALFINALLFVPQIIKVLREKRSDEFSKITFVGFCLTQLTSIVYGYLRDDKILMIGYMLALTLCGILTILIFVYSKKKK